MTSPDLVTGKEILADFRLLEITGSDAQTFLAAQFTGDIRQLTPLQSQFTAWCNAKGQVLATFHIFHDHESYYLLLPSEIAPTFIKRLKMFVLRAQVNIQEKSSAEAIVCLQQTPLARYVSSPDQNSWRLADIQAVIPHIFPATAEHYLPQMLNLDLTSGLSFNKGCYPGQEVIARLHYRGQLKRCLYRGRAMTKDLPLPGTPLRSLGRELAAGEILYAAELPDQGSIALLAVVEIAAIEAGNILLEDGIPVILETLR